MNQYELLIVLEEVMPKCYRKIIVQGWITFEDLHKIIQISMGWRDYHLFEFQINGEKVIVSHQNEYAVHEELLASECVVGLYLDNSRTNVITYIYDFGDNWQHEITVRKVEILDKEVALLVEAEGACPPEDVGGVQGYEEFTQLMNEGSKEELEWQNEWLKSQKYNAESTHNINEINKKLKKATSNMKIKKSLLN